MFILANFFIAISLAGLVLSLLGGLVSLSVRRNYALRYTILQAALWGLLLAPALATVFGYWNVSWLRWNPATVIAAERTFADAPATEATLPDSAWRSNPDSLPPYIPSPNIPNARATEENSLANQNTTSDSQFSVSTTDNASNRAQPPSISIVPSATTIQLNPLRSTPAILLILVCWLVGAMIGLMHLAHGMLQVYRLRKRLKPISEDRLALVREQLASRSVVLDIPVMTSPDIRMFMVLGIVRPVIVLPENTWDELEADSLADALDHELAHVRRSDNLTLVWQRIVASLYWHIPSVYWLNHLLEQTREDVCDNHVLQHRDAIDYGKTLLRLAELVIHKPEPVLSSTMFHIAGKLESRVLGLLQANRNTHITASWSLMCMLTLFFFFVSAVLSSSSLRKIHPQMAAELTPISDSASSQTFVVPPEDRDVSKPEFAGSYFGQVLDASGTPLAGARIYLMNNKNKDQGKSEIGPVRALTDGDGRFDFHAPDMTYTHFDGLTARREGLLIAAKEGYAPDWQVAWGHTSNQGSHWDPYKDSKLELYLAKSDVPFQGTLLAPNGQPLVNAKVRVSEIMAPPDENLDTFLEHWKSSGGMGGFLSSGPSIQKSIRTPEFLPGVPIEAQTDSQGHFVLTGLPRDRLVNLHIIAPEIVSTTIMAMVREAPTESTNRRFPGSEATSEANGFIYGSKFSLTMQPGLTVRGRVIDKQTKQPVVGMWVGPLSNIVNKPSSDLYPWKSDAEGRFTITGLSPEILKTSPNQNPNEKPPHYQMIVAATTPGLPYTTAWSYIQESADGQGAEEMLIEVERGIPFHLKLVDEQGKPVDAEVTYLDVVSNNEALDEVIYPVSLAANHGEGKYSGFVLPGPGAIFVKTHWRQHFRPVAVDPKSFFAPGKNDWTAEQERFAYGTTTTLVTHQGKYLGVYWRGNVIQQRDYSAIVLVNPATDSPPLELTATLKRYKTRKVYFYGPDGQPITDIASEMNRGGHSNLSDHLRGSSLDLTDLSPESDLEVIFSKYGSSNEGEKFVALALVREDGPVHTGSLAGNIPSPDNDPRSFTVQLLKAARVKGRLVDEDGKPMDGAGVHFRLINGQSHTSAQTDSEGRFESGTIYPGHQYRIEITDSKGILLEKRLSELVLEPGEVRDLENVVVTPLPDKAME